MRIATVTFICAMILLACGCGGAKGRIAAATDTVNLKEQNRQCTDKLHKSQVEVEQLKKQVAVISELKSGLKLESLYNLQSLTITRYTGLYDNEAGKKERLVVYIQPIDDDGDVIKATGSVDVELWDLSKPDHAQLGKWHIEPAELKKMWVATLVSINYRLPFDVGDKILNTKGDLTVKVTFTDYIFGKVFTEQFVVKRI
jgi:hypothetical protein